MLSTAVVVGNPRPHSKTLRAAEQVAEALTGRQPRWTIDVVEFGAELLDSSSDRVADAKDHVLHADVLVAASPTYKGSYTGLLKAFLDRFARDELLGTIAVPVMVGGSLEHAMAPEILLKPVLVEIGALCPTRALFLLESDLSDPTAVDEWARSSRDRMRACCGVLADLALGAPLGE